MHEPTARREREMLHFLALDQDEQRAAIARLSASGMGDYGIAAATAISVEAVRRILGEIRAQSEQTA